ncbi:MAG: D-lysine 5,6-aminomutase subunit alpha [Deltaproteobacteria bacterium RIFCSPLOWO2_12_FULL_40_28]|nr:MAG: D-lysine 5,6-aminomutase subunit alpha [Deltaproteobacteria bacterium RIFCSPHIGHO2_02_FULL_40_28]OGQ18897.1 MAG: D-lysine 5,6-aminomutase subunit alpha [Deltaproteobacteria bacterium RIFCSPHIGHO2_12_FULL_40_32]OGQ40142.1 MAG: D-lysine 5,6-aminomutase subunit alpha [Deltaproteobacteria bacterium RIFCSPLOWO2_02_FULL_40_36]OGQ53325.1 MAG: D-lysine 5,6-aminomutase subunit alpha [Deltaproteobacteria bacterium RIFCSPLOWO2_12_FULL_40_28]
MAKLNLDRDKVDVCRELASALVHPVQKYIDLHSTVSIERSVLRLMGLTGALKDENGNYPLANLIVDKMDRRQLSLGIATWIGAAKLKYDAPLEVLATRIIQGKINLADLPEPPPEAIRKVLLSPVSEAIKRIDFNRKERERLRSRSPFPRGPMKYVIVATGNIHEDVKQAIAAAQNGADVIAVIRSTAQSLLDYVPHGATTEGYGGTYATQENFKIMRSALNDLSQKMNRYIRLCNYSSGLCMPEIAVMGAQESLDFLLNDAMYGILFRDINMKRTFVDQFFSRVVTARAGIVIQTGEDNYLTTADAFNNHHQVLASHFINEQFAKNAGMREEQIGLGHAFEMDPAIEDSFLFEVAMAELVRDIFSRHPIKYMPPTLHKEGDIFFSHVLDALFNLAGCMTNQAIQLLGMPTEAIHNPFLMDRFSSIKSANYIFKAASSLGEEIQFNANGKLARRARTVLDQTHEYLLKIKDMGLMESIERGFFAEMPRPKDGGRGLDGVFQKARRYYNPFLEKLGSSR